MPAEVPRAKAPTRSTRSLGYGLIMPHMLPCPAPSSSVSQRLSKWHRWHLSLPPVIPAQRARSLACSAGSCSFPRSCQVFQGTNEPGEPGITAWAPEGLEGLDNPRLGPRLFPWGALQHPLLWARAWEDVLAIRSPLSDMSPTGMS